MRTGGRAVECTGLENRQGFTPFVGSNPTPSANGHGAAVSKGSGFTAFCCMREHFAASDLRVSLGWGGAESFLNWIAQQVD